MSRYIGINAGIEVETGNSADTVLLNVNDLSKDETTVQVAMSIDQAIRVVAGLATAIETASTVRRDRAAKEALR